MVRKLLPQRGPAAVGSPDDYDLGVDPRSLRDGLD